MTGYADIARQLPGPVAIPESWKQGRTAYGGLTAALCVEAARAQIDDLPPLRSVQMNFTGPVSGAPVFEAELLRRGRNVASVGVRARDADRAVGDALLVFGASRESALDFDDAPPEVPGVAEAGNFFPEGSAPFVPNFIRNFEVRFAGGALPISGAEEGRIIAWVRHKDLDMREGMAGFVCLGDVLPPAAFAVMRAPAPISSVNWMLNLLREPETDDGWFLIDSHQTAAREGYSSQRMRFWNTSGQLVAEGMQAVAVFA